MMFDRIDIIRQDTGVGTAYTLLGCLPNHTDLLGFCGKLEKAREMASKRANTVVDYVVFDNRRVIGNLLMKGKHVEFDADTSLGVAIVAGDRVVFPVGSSVYQAIGAVVASRSDGR